MSSLQGGRAAAVIGAGEMGRGIAEVLAIAGYEVRLMDVKREALDSALGEVRSSLEKLAAKGGLRAGEGPDDVMGRLSVGSDTAEAVRGASVVVEAVPEDLGLKRRVFKQLGELAEPDAILASNTSGIRITEIAQECRNPNRVLGMHFFNPPVLMKLVEVIRGEATGDDQFNRAVKVVEELGKVPVKVMRDTPGFVANRVMGPELLYFCMLIERGLATPEQVDSFLRGQGMPMGAYELIDYVGVDVVDGMLRYFAEELSPDYGKCSTYSDMVKAGRTGKKAGRGFYDWSSGRPKIPSSSSPSGSGDVVSLLDLFSLEINEAVKLIEQGVATPEDIETGVRLGLNRPFGPVTVAKGLTNAEVRERLEKLSQDFQCGVFAPTDSIRAGRMRDAVEGRLQPQPPAAPQAAAGPGAQQPRPRAEAAGYRTISLERSNRVATITVDRPKVNAISPEVLEELDRALDELWSDDSVVALVIRGKGNTFSAGADLSTFINGGFQFLEYSRRGQRAFRRLSEIPKVTIASLKGYALGGAFELALACDLRVSTPDAEMGFPEVTRGLIPAWGGTQRLPKLVGYSRALEIVLTGRRIRGSEAAEMGIVNRVAQDPDSEATSLAQEIASNVAPISAALAKRLINKGAEVPMDVGLEMESMAAGVVFGTDDLKEGISAFMQKRRPEYKGR